MSIVTAASKRIRVEDCNNTVMVTHCPAKSPEDSPTRKLDADTYVVKETGEVREYSKERGDNLHSLRQSFNRLKAVINCNYEEPGQIRFITLTYRENMTDSKRLCSDLQKFFRNMKRCYGPFEYVYVKERQGRGAWHVHAILFFDHDAPFMENSEQCHPVRDAWGHGYVNIRAFRSDINNLGNYLCAYLTDEKDDKGARLAHYDAGTRLFSCSRGVRRPEVSQIGYDEYERMCKSPRYLLVSQNDVDIRLEDGTCMRVTKQIFTVDKRHPQDAHSS